MRKSALDHPLWFVELALVPAMSALLFAALLFPDDRLLVGLLVGVASGLPAGVGVTLAVTRSKPGQARRTAPVALLDDVIEGEYREIAA